MDKLSDKPIHRVVDVDWYDADTLRDTLLFAERKTTRFSLVEIHNLKQGVDFIYTAHASLTEVKAERNNRSDKVLLSCEWVRRWLESNSYTCRAAKRARVADDDEEAEADEEGDKEGGDEDEDEEEDESTMLLSEVPMPNRIELAMLPRIQLDEDDWFMGFDLSFRGERHPDYIYVRGPDVARVLDIRLTAKARKHLSSSNYVTVFEGDKPITYLRYLGLIRLLFSVQKKGLAERFQKWATRVLFAFQFRPTAGTNAVRIPQTLCRPFFQVAVGDMAGFFACWIQSVDALRNDIQIPTELAGGPGHGVYRIGFAANLAYELTVLTQRFSVLSRAVVDELQLVAFAHIDKSLFSAAQRDWDGIAAELHGKYFRLFNADMGLYVLHENDIPKVRAFALQLQIRFSSNIVHHIRMEVTNELAAARQLEMDRLHIQHEREILTMQRMMHKRA